MKKERKKDRKRREKRERKARRNGDHAITEGVVDSASHEKQPEDLDGPRRVDFAVGNGETQNELGLSDSSATRRPFTLRGITGTIRPQIPKTLSQNVFSQSAQPSTPISPSGPIPCVRYGIRRTNSLPDRLNQNFLARAPSTGLVPIRAGSAAVAVNQNDSEDEDQNISRTTAICLLLISTGLVAVCAEFMVDSINAVVSSNSGLSEAFIGLIILPIVGNAAEHVTAVTVASKNKMDLAIGVAVGSSIQIGTQPSPFPPLLHPSLSPSCISPNFKASANAQNSALRDTLHSPPRLVHVQRNVAVLHALRNGIPLRLRLYRQFPRLGREE